MTHPAPTTHSDLCAQLGTEFPELDAATVKRAVDHGMRVAQLQSGSSEELVWARASVLARDHLDAASHHASRISALRRIAPLAI